MGNVLVQYITMYGYLVGSNMYGVLVYLYEANREVPTSAVHSISTVSFIAGTCV